MPEQGGKEVTTERHDRIFFTALAIITLFALALKAEAQVLRQGETEAIVAPLGIPCEPGDLVLGMFPCAPVEAQGVLIHVRSDDWRTGTHESYSVTITYRTSSGERRTATCGGDNPCPKRERTFGKEWDDGWRTVGFNIGRLATGPLSGITVESVAVAKVQAPVVIKVEEQ